jgi:SAM-dependent methyltransferase
VTPGRNDDDPADYGIDAPPAVAFLFVASLFCFAMAVFGTSLASRLSARWALVPGVILLAEAVLMIRSSRSGKLRMRDRVLDAIPWRGDEAVLDVGCGRGLMLIGAAKRLPKGMAHGVDVWKWVDQSGNARAATARNARAEGVSEHVSIHDADARELPFPDRSFDVIVSSFALHNIHPRQQRARALQEIVRVLRPGGRIAIVDIRSTRQYARIFAASGLRSVSRSGLGFQTFPPFRVVTATKPAGG